MAKMWLIYDGRAWSEPTEDAAVYVGCASHREVREGFRIFPDGAAYEYDVAEDGKTLINEQGPFGHDAFKAGG